MKCHHIWRKFFDVNPAYTKTGRKWYQFWLPEYRFEKRTITKYKECVVCKKRKYIGEEDLT